MPLIGSRREFLKVVSAVSLAQSLFPNFLLAKDSPSRIPIAFSTLGCPSWEWKKILDFATQHGFAAIELRGLQGNMDLPSNPLFAADRLSQTKSEIQASNAAYCLREQLGKSVRGECGKAGERAKRCAPFYRSRLFSRSAVCSSIWRQGPNRQNSVPDEPTKARVAAGLRELGTYAGPRKVTVIIESHDHFTSSATLKDVLHAADSEHVGLLWDAHHTFATSNEAPEDTVKQLGQWIRHTHLKDSVGSGEDRHYVLTGRGNVPIERQIKALQSIQYKGFYCFEWEKVWHPDLQDPEIAIADYARVVGQCLGNANACGL